ncbi:protein toll-like [Melitaea cinxia]|uniref:protein toll-like n=1 Tax=Melitaea cinxia TaxID=113334 RepID=UPI001E270449|nr:protein toll-like [Melitaea cinxia]
MLSLWNNKIEFIDVDAFEGLTKLVNLSLNANLLTHLPGGMFRHTPNVARLDLYANKLLDLSDDLFTGLNKLEQILIFDNKAILKLSNKTFSNLPSLYDLKLDRCFIENIPAELFRNTTNLKKLSLQGNNIKYLPNNTFKGLKLIYLNLSHNKISYLNSDVFSEQTSMTELKLSYNELKSLPGELFSNMNSLKILDLGQNSIGYLNKSIFNGLGNLKELSLNENRLEYLDHAIFEFTSSLEVLSLSKNKLTISEEENVRKIIEPSFTLDDDESASPIIAYYSPLKNLVRLRTLDLSHNNVSIICEDWTKMFSLTELDLSYNNITSLSIVDFNFSTDSKIDLRHNNIERFELPINSQYTTDATFLMDYNPYRCDCNLYYFIHNYKLGTKMPKINIKKAECAQPTALKGVKLVNLQPDVLTCDVDCKTGGIIKHPSNDSNCKCILNPVQLRLEMFCDYLPEVYPKLPQQLNSTYLKLRYVTDVPLLPAEVKIVDFSSLNLTEPPIANSVALNLTNNHLTKAPLELFQRNCSVYLSNNPFDCTCGGEDNVLALNAFKNLIPDYKNLTCSNGIFVSNTVVEQLCAVRNGAIISLSLGIIGILIITCTIIAFKYTTELRIILRKLGLWRGDVLGGEVYDAFVSFTHQDEDFVREKLLPKLEKGKPPLKICIHYRDWVIGDYIPAQISRSVDQSRYTIIVLSKNFVESMWGRMEFRTAHAKDRVIILMLDDLSADKSLDPELRAYISMNTYVKADDPLVWERLRDAVLHRKRSDLKSDKLTSTMLDVTLENGQLVNRAMTAPSV